MENAVKALLMASGVLIGIMIISLAVALFSSLSEYSGDSQKRIEENAIQAFNEKFTKYINCPEDSNIPEFELKIQDIVTAANTAHENNYDYSLEEADEFNYYVKVIVDGVSLEKSIKGQASSLLKENIGANYICKPSYVKINKNTSRIYEINFHKV